jgi:hypothetical protein
MVARPRRMLCHPRIEHAHVQADDGIDRVEEIYAEQSRRLAL